MSAASFAIRGQRNMGGRDLDAGLGGMRERITLSSVALTKAAGGFASRVSTVVAANLPADVQELAGVEAVIEGGVRGQIVIEARIRYRAGVQLYWEVAWRGTTYQVLEPPVNHDGRRRFLWLRCGRIGTAQTVST